MQGVTASVTTVMGHLVTENIWLGNYENYKTVVVPILECSGLPGEQICGWAEDSFLFFKCIEVVDLPGNIDLHVNETLIQDVTGFSYDGLCAFCIEQEPPLIPLEYIKEKAQEMLRSLSVSMTSVKLFLTLVQFLKCMQQYQDLDQNEHSIKLISRNLDNFGRREMNTIVAFLQSPAGAAVFRRQPENAMPNPWLGGITPQWLDEARGTLNQISADIDEAMHRAKNLRFWSIVNTGFSLTKIAHSVWTWRVAANASSEMKLHFMHAASIGADATVGALSLNSARVAHIQVGKLQALEVQLSKYVDAVGDAEYVFAHSNTTDT